MASLCDDPPEEELSFTDAVLAYRDQIVAENIFRRLHGKFLGLTPLYAGGMILPKVFFICSPSALASWPSVNYAPKRRWPRRK